MAWSLESSTSYEAAREAINHLLAIRVAERARGEAKAEPDAKVLQQLGADIVRLGQERRRLDPDDAVEIRRIRAEYGALIRQSPRRSSQEKGIGDVRQSCPSAKEDESQSNPAL